ncbi:MAG: hypothetical protein PUE18_06640 [Firmicutes bacterium]|nr:hypothetical protein [Bacillota bacterium]
MENGLEINPMAQNYTTANAYLAIDGGTANCNTTVNGILGKTTKIMVRMYLQEYSGSTWKTIDNWSSTKTGTMISFEKTATVSKGSKYRVKADITAYAGVERESITKYSSVISY